MGSKGGGSTQTATSTNSPPPDVMANYDAVTAQAKQVAATPYTAYSGQLVSPFNSTEQAGLNAIAPASTAYQPYYGQAQGLIGQGTQQYTPTQFSSGAVGQYESPYTQDVINSTMANINQNNAEQQQSLTGNAIAQGAWGGDRADLAKNDLARQQALASNQTIAGLENQNYQQALGQFNTANQTGLQAASLNNQSALTGAGLQGALGNNASQLGLTGANALLGAGALQQQTAQNADTAAYQQFQQQQAYPFQTTQWLSGIDTGLGSQMGGTSTTTQPNQNYQSPTQSLIGTGLAAAGLFFKDGGKINGYAPGGGVSNFPDFNISYVPTGSPFSGGSTMPTAPIIQQSAPHQSPIQAGLGGLSGAFSGGDDGSLKEGLKSFGSNLFGGGTLKDSAGFGLSDAGFGNMAYDMLDFAKGGSVGYAPGGWVNQPLFDSPMYSTPQQIALEQNGQIPLGGSVGGLPLSPEMNDKLAMDMAGTSPSPTDESQMSPIAGFKDPTNLATPSDMSALLATSQPTLGQSTMPNTQAGIVANNTATQASDAPQGIVSDQPQALTDLQKELAANAPKLDKGQALMAAGAAIMQGGLKNNTQALGAGLAAGLQNYGQQKAAVRDYALKEAEVQKQVQQMALEASRYNKTAELQDAQIAAIKGGKGTNPETLAHNAYLVANPGASDADAWSAAAKATAKPAAAGSSDIGDKTLIGTDSHGDDYLKKSGMDSTTAAVVKMIAHGEINPGTASSRNPYVALNPAVKQYDNDFTGDRFAFRQAFDKPGPNSGSGQLTAIDQATAHLGQLYDSSKDLKNGKVQSVNEFVNSIKNQTGDPSVVDFDTAKIAVASELVRVFRGAGGTGEEVNRLEKTLSSANSPDQMKGAVTKAMGLMNGRIQAIGHNYKRVLGKDSDTSGFYSDETKKRFSDMGVKMDTGISPSSATSYLNVPEGGKLIGTSGGKSVYQMPDGSHVMEK